jgi:hypothetical protein
MLKARLARVISLGAFEADGADEHAHLVFLLGEDMLDQRADFGFGGI